MKNQRYILKDNEPQLCEDLVEWAMWMGESDRQIARDEIGDVRVSTSVGWTCTNCPRSLLVITSNQSANLFTSGCTHYCLDRSRQIFQSRI